MEEEFNLTNPMFGFKVNPYTNQPVPTNVNTDSSFSTLGNYGNSSFYGGFNLSNAGYPDSLGTSDPSTMQILSGYKDAKGNQVNGMAGFGLAAVQGLWNGYLGMQQLNSYKTALKQSQDQFNKNYAAQAQTTNASLEDRQRARLATGGNYQSVGDYMNQHRIA